MAQFRKTRGQVGWPGPQVRQIEGWARTWNIEVHGHIAQTGTHYLTLTGDDGDEITVRIADHADAYATADYTVNPAEDQREAIRRWIHEHGSRTTRRTTAQLRRIARELAEAGWTVVQPTSEIVHVTGGGYVLARVFRDAHSVNASAPASLRTCVESVVATTSARGNK